MKCREPNILNQIRSIKPTKLSQPNHFSWSKSRETKSTEYQSKVQFQLDLSLAQLSPSLLLHFTLVMKKQSQLSPFRIWNRKCMSLIYLHIVLGSLFWVFLKAVVFVVILYVPQFLSSSKVASIIPNVGRLVGQSVGQLVCPWNFVSAVSAFCLRPPSPKCADVILDYALSRTNIAWTWNISLWELQLGPETCF